MPHNSSDTAAPPPGRTADYHAAFALALEMAVEAADALTPLLRLSPSSHPCCIDGFTISISHGDRPHQRDGAGTPP